MKDEIGLSLNPECKKMIDEFIENNFVKNNTLLFWRYVVTELVEKCIYTDNHAKSDLEYGTNE